jgi:phosphoadenosine phosphosulfate reductase
MAAYRAEEGRRSGGSAEMMANLLQATHLNLVTAVKKEVEKPFSEKLKRTKELISLYAKMPTSSVSCSFGKDSMLVTHLCQEISPKIPVVFENTLNEFPETIDLKRRMAEEWNVVELHPAAGVNFWSIQERILKSHLHRDDGRKHSNLCCYHLKERPFNLWRRKTKTTLSFTGITACESRHRMFIACDKGAEYYSLRDDCWKINPITYWTPQEVWEFTHDSGIPINEAYSKYGLDRLGCMFCFSYKSWRQDIARRNPKAYAFIMKHYFNTPCLSEYYSELEEDPAMTCADCRYMTDRCYFGIIAKPDYTSCEEYFKPR